MVIDSEATAHEYALAWKREASPTRAERFIRFAEESQRKIVASLRSSGHVVRAEAHEGAVRVLQSYLA